MEERLSEDTEALLEIKGKKLVMIFGITGAGKSTLTNRLVSGDVVEFNDDEGKFELKPGTEIRHPVS